MNQIDEHIHKLQVDRTLKEGIYDDLLNNRISVEIDKPCPLCTRRKDNNIGTMQRKTGPYGTFLSCNRYPECKFSWNTPLDEKTNPNKSH